MAMHGRRMSRTSQDAAAAVPATGCRPAPATCAYAIHPAYTAVHAPLPSVGWQKIPTGRKRCETHSDPVPAADRRIRGVRRRSHGGDGLDAERRTRRPAGPVPSAADHLETLLRTRADR